MFPFTPSTLTQEMRFNPLIVLWAYLGLDVLCGRAIRATPPLDPTFRNTPSTLIPETRCNTLIVIEPHLFRT